MKTGKYNVISTCDVIENDQIIAQIHLMTSIDDVKGLLVCKRAYGMDEADTYSIGRDDNGHRICFEYIGDFIPVDNA